MMSDLLLNLGIAAAFTILGFVLALVWEWRNRRQARNRRARMEQRAHEDLEQLRQARRAETIEMAKSLFDKEHSTSPYDKFLDDLLDRRTAIILAGIPYNWHEFVNEVLIRLDRLYRDVMGVEGMQRAEWSRMLERIQMIEVLREVEGDN